MPDKQNDPILDDLNESQRDAVEFGDGALLIVAGAGSGKTRVITRRIAHLVHRGVPGRAILAVTFTNKAADEMHRRVEFLVGGDVLVTTFHSFCSRLLRHEIQHLGMEPSFTIYDKTDSARQVRQICRLNDLDVAFFSPAKLLAEISVHKNRIETAADCVKHAVGMYEETAAKVYAHYEERLRANNALDFDDLLLKTVELFRSCPEVLQKYQDRYRHVLVDEYQDTNLPQHLIMRALQGKHHNITAVGDPDQMIYTWRGARLENILEFADDFPGAKTIILERNYRSTANILHAASVCVSHNKLRHDKVLRTESEPGEPVRIHEFEEGYEEAQWVAKTAERLVKKGMKPNEIAVLYRTKYQSREIEGAFLDLGLPYQVVDTVGFFDRKQVKDLRAYMQLVLNARDDEAFQRIVNVPARGVGEATVLKLQQAAWQAGKPMLLAARDSAILAALGPRAKTALAKFGELYDRLVPAAHGSVHLFLKKIIDETDYMDCVSSEDREDAHEIVESFLDHANQYDKRSNGGDLLGFLEQTALVNDVDGWSSTMHAVPFMTLHSAKGLEFDVVVITGVEEECLPHRRSLEDNPFGDENYALEEERRLLHVGMTRARKELYLTFVRTRMIRGHEESIIPSRFLDELPSEGVGWESHCIGSTGKSARDFDLEVRQVLSEKRPSVKTASGATHETVGVGVEIDHPTYGHGTVLSTDTAGKHQLLRIDFQKHGVLTILLAAGASLKTK